MRYTMLGAEFAAIFFAFIYGGHALDARLGSKPWLLLVGIFLGFGIALYRLIFVARKLGEENDRD
ncbi:MAG: AtpZ/AtpI family protein [Spirochaetes bacterium]|nr:AtpZ/AtpI family protein [Spirochaetota bacterium]